MNKSKLREEISTLYESWVKDNEPKRVPVRASDMIARHKKQNSCTKPVRNVPMKVRRAAE